MDRNGISAERRIKQEKARGGAESGRRDGERRKEMGRNGMGWEEEVEKGNDGKGRKRQRDGKRR